MTAKLIQIVSHQGYLIGLDADGGLWRIEDNGATWIKVQLHTKLKN